MESSGNEEKKGFSLGDRLSRRGRFLGSTTSWEAAELVLLGVPMDCTTSFRPGARFGPTRVREISDGLEEYSFYLDRSLTEMVYYDAGDVPMVFGDVDTTLARIKGVITDLVSSEKVPLLIGGEHLVSLPAIEALADQHEQLMVLHFDAHADLRDEYLGQKLSHATVMRRVAERIGPQRLYQFGIRSGTDKEFRFGHQYTHFYPDEVLEPFRDCLAELGQYPVYVTIDIDVVDPAFAPGTGAPEPVGCTPREIMEVIHLLGCLNIVGVDIVELSPPQDYGDITAILVAKLVRETLLSIRCEPLAGLP